MKQMFLIVIAVLAVVPSATYPLWQGAPDVLRENHLIESAQAALLFFAASIRVFQIGRLPPCISVARLYHHTLALFCLSLFIREVDINRFGSHPAWSAIEIGVRASVAGLWLYLLIQVLKHRHPIWAQRPALLMHPGSLLVYGGILCYGASWFFDKEVLITGEAARFVEETLQLQATALLFLSALALPYRSASAFPRSGGERKPCRDGFDKSAGPSRAPNPGSTTATSAEPVGRQA